MYVSRANEKLVLNLQHPARVTAVIPSAKEFEFKGQRLVAVPHRLDEVRVLRNLGFDETPSPIDYHYDFPMGDASKTPFKAQLMTASFLTMNPKAFVLNELGTGKTLATLWAWHYLYSAGLAKRLLVVAPLSTLERTWADEVFQNFPELSVAVLHGTKAKRLKLLADDYDVYVINHDGIKVIGPALVERTDIDTIVVDEIAKFRNASTDAWKALRRVCNGRERVWGLTGSPTPEKPTDAWAQCRLISPERVPKYFSAFRDATMQAFGQFAWLPRPNAMATVAEAMQPAIRFTRDQCVDLPPAIWQTREVALTAEQKAAYKDMVAKLTMEYEQQQVTAVNQAVKHFKLLQIACGVVYTGDGEEVVLPNQPRIDALKDIIEEAEGKVIIFVPFKSALRYVQEELAKSYTVEAISGDVSKGKRDKIFAAFQQTADPRVLVAVADAMSHGLTLTKANTIVWYAPTNKNEVYEQANARITRPGQKRTQFIIELEGTPVERNTYKRLRVKGTMQGVLLDSLKEAV